MRGDAGFIHPPRVVAKELRIERERRTAYLRAETLRVKRAVAALNPVDRERVKALAGASIRKGQVEDDLYDLFAVANLNVIGAAILEDRPVPTE